MADDPSAPLEDDPPRVDPLLPLDDDDPTLIQPVRPPLPRPSRPDRETAGESSGAGEPGSSAG